MTNNKLFRRSLMDGRIRDEHGAPVLRLVERSDRAPRDYAEDDEPMPFAARPSTLPDPWILGVWLILAGVIAIGIGVTIAQLAAH